MVELAIILPLLLFILFGITELGRALYQQNILTQAVALGGRYMARVEGAVNADSCDIVDETKWAGAVAEAKNLIEFGCGIGDTTTGCEYPVLPNIIVDEPDVSPITSGAVSACVITVKATANFQSIFGDAGDVLVSLPGLHLDGVQLNATTQERYIGR
ncbi:MAG: pilus assembly protein [Gammaproteobacteria bacterium]|nr:pilus assembly protein [Gammaproteobacteria bacterium]